MSQDRIEQHFEVLNAISDLTFFPKKTSIAECLLEFDKYLKQRLKLDYRQEAYAVKSMFLHVTSLSFQVTSGVKLRPGVLALCKKFRDRQKAQDNFLSSVRNSPTFQKYRAKQQESPLKRLVLPISWTTPSSAAASDASENADKKADSDCVGLMSSSGLRQMTRPNLAWQLDIDKQRGPPRDFKLLLQQELDKLRSSEPVSSSNQRLDMAAAEDVAAASPEFVSLEPASSSNQRPGAKRFVYSWDHFHGQGKRLDVETGESEMVSAMPCDDSFLHCKFSCGFDLNTGVPALAVKNAEALVAASKPLRNKKSKAKTKAKAKAKAEAKAKAKASRKAVTKAASKPMAKGSAKAKAEPKAKAKAKAQAAPGMTLDDLAASFRGEFSKVGAWVLVQKIRGAKDKLAGESYFEYISPDGIRYRSKSQALKHGFVENP